MIKRIVMVIGASILCMLFAATTILATVLAVPAEVPKSGQTSVYSPGDDGSLQTGVAWPSPRFTASSSGGGTVMTDALTGLMWPQNGGTPTVGSCGGGPNRTWQQALEYVTCLNEAGYLGHNDWRLPNVNELESLMAWNLWLIDRGFTNVADYHYWSSTTVAQDTWKAWRLSMGAAGWLEMARKSNPWGFAWPVRGGEGGAVSLPKTGQLESYAAGDDGDLQKGVDASGLFLRFIPIGNTTGTMDGPVMVDLFTGLQWTRDGGTPAAGTCMGGEKSWQAALDYVACLNESGYLGYSDWRLPNRKELRSLVDYGEPDNVQWLNDNEFTNVPWSGWYWTSTSLDSTTAWFVFLQNGEANCYANKADSRYVWPVRGGKGEALAYLTITKAGEGEGLVEIDRGALIWSGNTGTASYGSPMTVNITAIPYYHSALL